jgi:hypothetical protein
MMSNAGEMCILDMAIFLPEGMVVVRWATIFPLLTSAPAGRLWKFRPGREPLVQGSIMVMSNVGALVQLEHLDKATPTTLGQNRTKWETTWIK